MTRKCLYFITWRKPQNSQYFTPSHKKNLQFCTQSINVPISLISIAQLKIIPKLNSTGHVDFENVLLFYQRFNIRCGIAERVNKPKSTPKVNSPRNVDFENVPLFNQKFNIRWGKAKKVNNMTCMLTLNLKF